MPILKWLTRDEDLKKAGRANYRLLKENVEYSYGNKDTDNMIIHGDNLEGLKALLPFYAGQVKCIYIDPPYNTGSRIDADGKDVGYDDNLEHSIWLSMMQPRLELLREFLREDGVIFVQIDDTEQAYLKVLMDEVFGRNNFLNTIIVKTKVSAGASGGGEDKKIKKNVEFLLMYCKNKALVSYKQIFKEIPIETYIAEHKDEGTGFYYTRILKSFGDKKLIAEINGMKVYEHTNFEFTNISNVMKEENLSLKEAYFKYFDQIFMVTNAQTSLLTKVNDLVKEKNKLISYEYIPTTGRYKGSNISKYIWNETLVVWLRDSSTKQKSGVYKKEQLGTSWDDISWGRLDLEGKVKFKNGKKPEALIQRIMEMTTDCGDLILDSFLGSGTTIAVAQKMGRRYIGIEMGKHAITHILPRLRTVVDGDDSGISENVNWQGGGGFRFYELGDTIFNEDGCINPDITYEQLSAHLWFYETKTPFTKAEQKSTVLGIYKGTAYALLYNGILRDKSIDGGNVLTSRTLDVIKADLGDAEYDKLVIYGEASRLGENRMRENNIEFKQTPYDIKVK